MRNGSKRIAIVTNVVPSYRLDFYRALIEQHGENLTIYCQDSIPGMALQTVHDQLSPNVHLLKHTTALDEKIGWQCLPMRQLLRQDVIFFYGNPRIISNVFFSLILLLLRRKVVIWGQVHTAGSKDAAKKIRLAWWRLFEYCFVYTDKEIILLEQQGFYRQTIIGMNNGLDQKKIDRAKSRWPQGKLTRWKQANNLLDRPVFLSCARLVSKNRFEECIHLLERLKGDGIAPLWVVIGDGPERKVLKRLAVDKGVQDQILWQGAMYSEGALAPWFMSANFFLHPAGIGLSLLHAMGYGLPVITQDDKNLQMPEFAAFSNGETGLLYEAGNVTDFRDKVCALLNNDRRRLQMGLKAEYIARNRYNTDVMVERFNLMVKYASGRWTA